MMPTQATTSTGTVQGDRHNGRKSKGRSARSHRFLGKMKLIMCPLTGLLEDHDPVAYNQRTMEAYNCAGTDIFPGTSEKTSPEVDGAQRLKKLIQDLRHETADNDSSSTQPSSDSGIPPEQAETVKARNHWISSNVEDEFEISFGDSQDEKKSSQALKESRSDLVSELTDPEEKNERNPRFSRFVLMQKQRENSILNEQDLSDIALEKKFVPFPCICGRGERCKTLSIAFSKLNDPRSGYTKVPHLRYKVTTRLDLEVNRLRDSFLRCMLSVEDQERFDDSKESRYIANHHFHPEVLSQAPNESGHSAIPMFFSETELKRLNIDFSPKDQVVDFDGSPTEYYYVVPNYRFEDAKRDLKKIENAKKGIPQNGVEEPSNGTLFGEFNRQTQEHLNNRREYSISEDASMNTSRKPRINELRAKKNESLDKVNDLLSILTDSTDNENKTRNVERDLQFDPFPSPLETFKPGECTKEDKNDTWDSEDLHDRSQKAVVDFEESEDFDAFETDMRLFSFESKRRTMYAEKMAITAVKWRSSVGWFQAGVTETAAAEHWVTMASNSVRFYTEDEYFRLKRKDIDQMESEPVQFLADVSLETKKVHQELENKIGSVKAVVNTTIAELKSAETSVAEAWDAFNAVATRNFFGGEESVTSSLSRDTWDLEMRYRVAVAAQASAWSMAMAKMSKLFACVKQTENERREWLLDLLVEVVGVASSFPVTRTPLNHIGALIQKLDEKFSKASQEDAMSLHNALKQGC